MREGGWLSRSVVTKVEKRESRKAHTYLPIFGTVMERKISGCDARRAKRRSMCCQNSAFETKLLRLDTK